MSKDIFIKLVETVERHPCLYDYTTKDYCNERAKSNAWENVSNEMKLSVTDCKDKWHNIRGRFLRQLKEVQPSGSGAKPKKNYYLNEYLHFLEPFTTSRNQTGNLTQNRELNDDVVENEDMLKICQQNNEIDDDLHDYYEVYPSASSPIMTSKRNITAVNMPSKKRDSGSALDELNKAAASYFKSKNVSNDMSKNISQEYNDPDFNFFKSILPDFKSLKPEIKRKLKITILLEVDKACQESQGQLS